MEKPETFGDYMKAKRLERKESLRQLEKRCGVPNATLSRIEDRIIAVPTPDRLMTLIDALELDLITAIKLIPSYRRMHERIVAEIQKGVSHE